MKLVTYTDTKELGGADLSLMHLLGHLGPEIEAAVVGASRPIVDKIGAARPGTQTLVAPRPRNDHDWRSLAAHVSAMRTLRPDVLHVSLASPWSCQYAIGAAALVRRPRVVAVYQLPVPPVSTRQRLTKRITSRAVDCHVGVGERTSREVEELIGLRVGSYERSITACPTSTLKPHRGKRPGRLSARSEGSRSRRVSIFFSGRCVTSKMRPLSHW
jgi:hypothetical protein